ncbi:hypothetical protein D3C86_1433290 [compost metagenome]
MAMLPSVAATPPVSGLRRKFCPVLVTNLIRSTVGLKSIEAIAPEIAGVKAVVLTGLEVAVAVLMM